MTQEATLPDAEVPASTPKNTATQPSRALKIAAITLGNGLEFFDFTIYTYFAAIIGRQFFPATSEWASLLMSLATFGVGFLMRPIGGVYIGHLADRYGRKPAMTLTLWLMALGSLIFVAAPTYAQIGIAAPILLILGRLVQGFAVGGEVGASTAMLLEYATDKTRGYYSSWQLFSQAVSTLVGSGVGLIVAHTLSTESLESWGWRIPFVFGLLLIPLGSFIRRNLDETADIHADKPRAAKLPIATLLREQPLSVLLGVTLVIGSTSANYIAMHYLTTYAKSILHMPFNLALWASWLAGLLQVLLCAYAGKLCDRLGRKPVAIVSRLILMALVFPAFMWMDAARSGVALYSAVCMLVIPLVFSSVSGIVMMSELFPRRVRASGLALCYGLGVSVFGGFSQFFATWLIQLTGSNLGPAWYVIGTGILTVIAIFFCKETAGKPLE
jgi:MFS transporter, MHS family, proline/betaine transporter